jgi:peptidoglycan/xylan/chitin deacetylase (PgdA/CDA1 family)
VDGSYIAMTFDDGPSAANTPRLLEILAQRHIKATFFLIGQNVQADPALAKRIHDEGHEIGNHSWTHPNLALLSDDKVRSELQMTDDAIYKAVGIHPTIMRPPYGSLSVFQRKWINKEFGYKIILWDVDTNDWRVLKGETPAERSARVENVILNGNKEEHAAHNGSIVLQHDIHATTIDAMPGTLDKLLAKGFKFVTVSELIAMDKPAPLAAAASGTSAAASGASATATSSPVH